MLMWVYIFRVISFWNNTFSLFFMQVSSMCETPRDLLNWQNVQVYNVQVHYVV